MVVDVVRTDSMTAEEKCNIDGESQGFMSVWVSDYRKGQLIPCDGACDASQRERFVKMHYRGLAGINKTDRRKERIAD